MSFTCTQNFVMDVTEQVPVVYYKCDTFVGSLVDDEVTPAYSLQSLDDPFVPFSGLISNALKVESTSSAAHDSYAYYGENASPHPVDVSGGSWTARFWGRFHNPNAAHVNDYVFSSFRISQVGTITMLRTNASGSYVSYVTLTLKYGGILHTNSISFSGFTDDVWYRILVRYNHTTYDIDIYINNTLLTTVNYGALQQNTTAGYKEMTVYIWSRAVNYTGAFSAIDEVGLWNYRMTDAQVSNDWNGGAGKTWP